MQIKYENSKVLYENKLNTSVAWPNNKIKCEWINKETALSAFLMKRYSKHSLKKLVS